MGFGELADSMRSRVYTVIETHKLVAGCLLGLTLISVVDVAILEIRYNPGRKTDANQFKSPWDRSYAPPPCINRCMVKIVKPQKKTQVAKRPVPKPAAHSSIRQAPSSTTAFASFGGENRASTN